MIVAYDKTGKKIRADETLPHVSEGGEYKCTYKWCPHPEMILRKGKHVMPHFAHKVGGGCDELAEADIERHLQIKDFMLTFLGVNVDDLDYGLIEGVRPDILYAKKYAIELQCSPISDDEIRRRNAIYIKNGLIPVWILDTAEFMDAPDRYGTRRLRVSERFIHSVQEHMLYFTVDSTKLDTKGFPTISLLRNNYTRPTEGSSKFHAVPCPPLTAKAEFDDVLLLIADQWTTFQAEVINQPSYTDADLYARLGTPKKWAKWRESHVCTGIKPTFGKCNKRFYVEPSSDQIKCDACIDAEILELWKGIQPYMTVTSVSVTKRNLSIRGTIVSPQFLRLDRTNAGQIMYHTATIDQLKFLFNLDEARYHDLRVTYENQLNRVFGDFTKVSDTEYTFNVRTLLREKKTKAHGTATIVI